MLSDVFATSGTKIIPFLDSVTTRHTISVTGLQIKLIIVQKPGKGVGLLA